jgi:Protein of unknown function (DUF4238)
MPRAYLERFATPRLKKPGRVIVYERGKDPQPRSTRSQGYENGYFRVVHADGQTDESMETTLARIEGDCLDALISARSELCDLSLVYVKLATYAAMLLRRSTVSRKANARRWVDIAQPYAELASNPEYIRDIAEYFSRQLNHEITADQVAQMIQLQSKRFSDQTFTKNNFVQDLLMFVAVGKQEMLKKFWQIWHATGGTEFVTSDNPVVTFVRTGATGEIWVPGFGFGYQGVVVGFPLAPDACLMMFDRPQPTERRSVDAGTVTRLNEVITACCDRFVYSRTRSDQIRETVDQIGGSSIRGVNAFMGRNIDQTLIENHMRNILGVQRASDGHEKQTTASTVPS